MQTQVLIIGAGVTGTGLARDLSMRGIGCVVVDKQDVNAGASGGNHGLLHSGARYVASDAAAAAECHAENWILKRVAPHCIEATGGMFVAVAGDDENYIADFAAACRRCRIPVRALDPKEALEMEPALSRRLIAAFAVDDATIDPFRISLNNMAGARQLGGGLLRHHRVTGFEVDAGRIRRTRLHDETTGRDILIAADVVVNAAGAWAGTVAGLAGASLSMRCSKGTLLVTQSRLSSRVINRLRRPTDGDILVPGGTVSILGTTSARVAVPDGVYPEIHEVDAIIEQGTVMMPALATTRYIRAFCGVRPLPGDGAPSPDGDGDDRAASRGFLLIDHDRAPIRLANLITITGGKLTTYRLMAEKSADLVCERLGVVAPCRTHREPLPDATTVRWTQPGLAPAEWWRRNASDDLLLCECEMVPQTTVDQVVAGLAELGGRPSLNAVALRSRVGKGPCQGTFCSQRLAAHLYDRGHLTGDMGIDQLRQFLRERWRGQRPLLWDLPLAQAELLEAMHCGLFGLELD